MCTRKNWLLWWTFILCFTASFARATTQEEYTCKLTQSTSSSTFWTTPPSERVFLDSVVPAATGSGLKLYAAKNEFEPLQVVILPTSTTTGTVQITAFGAGITVEIYQVKYVNITKTSDSLGRLGPYPDPLWPLENGDAVSLQGGVNTAFWFNVYVPASTPAGDYTATLMINGVSLPVLANDTAARPISLI